ncbi:MAG: phosphate regulon sensor histidine kinase PhoR [Woeseiaceae bacterium]|nr:phosphate regulon sensor histidine kinase PhoR [Woeseiaceae bacterium]
MIASSRKYVIGLVVLLAAGALIGWIYGETFYGFLIAALLALIWQVRQLLMFNRALHTGNFDTFRFGEGIWQQIYSRFSYERDRGSRYKKLNRQVIKEIRRSTNAMPDGAVILDEENEIVFCNRAAKTHAGIKRKKDRGQRVDNILRDPALTRLLQANDATRTADIVSPVSDERWLNCRVVPYGINQKLLLLRDVTERIVLNRMRRDFVANASHELRSPLTVVSGYLDAMAEDDTLSQSWGQPVRQMQEQAQRMTRIVAELLELSRLEGSGSASIDEIIDVGALLASACEALREQGDGPQLDLAIESTAHLRGNIAEIESVVVNLVSNAVRHTPADGRVSVSWQSGPDGAQLVVTDTGEGIAAEYLPRLTERFFRVDSGRAREDGGVGLGLAIVKHVLGRHEARLEISSELGVGSEFRCVFPPERIVVDPPIPMAGGS